MELREAFYRTFTDDPVNWIKWIAVLAILVLGYVIAIPIYGKVSYRLSWERKRDIAKRPEPYHPSPVDPQAPDRFPRQLQLAQYLSVHHGRH